MIVCLNLVCSAWSPDRGR